ncbi:MAG: hypothetical protein MJ237_04330 [bacterium]|nr:hypothetical protein [bacterium]
MGLAASSARFLALTRRQSDNKLELMKIATQKMSLTRDMNALTSEYRNQLNTKVLKWTINGGVSSVDLTYNVLMTPSTYNANKPYLLTDMNDRVVITSELKQYAEMLAPGGAPGGDWATVRSTILSGLLGIPQQDLDNAESYYCTYLQEKEIVDGLNAQKPDENAANYADWKTEYDLHKQAADDAINQYNELFTADEESQINFYDNIFSTIAEKGWICNDQVSNKEYLNDMLQNNQFNLTSVTTTPKFENNSLKYINNYNTNVAANCNKVISMNDLEAQELVEIDYEAEKSIITAKEKELDARSETLKTEQESIKTMLDSIKKVMQDNSENMFKMDV